MFFESGASGFMQRGNHKMKIGDLYHGDLRNLLVILLAECMMTQIECICRLVYYKES